MTQCVLSAMQSNLEDDERLEEGSTTSIRAVEEWEESFTIELSSDEENWPDSQPHAEDQTSSRGTLERAATSHRIVCMSSQSDSEEGDRHRQRSVGEREEAIFTND